MAVMYLPYWVNLFQMTDVMRGIIFIWLVSILAITVIILVKVGSGKFDEFHSVFGNTKYQ